MPGQFLTNRQSITSWNLPQPRISHFETVFPEIMDSLWSKFFCFLLSSLLPWVHLAEEKKMISTSIADLPEVPRLFLLSHTFFDQEIEADQTEQLNSDVVSLKEEITADWSQPGMEEVLFRSWLLLIIFIWVGPPPFRLPPIGLPPTGLPPFGLKSFRLMG